MKRFIILVLLLVCGTLLFLSQRHLSRGTVEGVAKEGDLYLPEPSYLKFISLGHDGLVADLVLAKALTYYGSHYRERDTFGFRHLEKVFYIAVEMDPRNREAILMAANILSDVDITAAIKILKRGMLHHPYDWKFPEMIGYFYFFRLNDPHQAGKYYEMAARLPGHPPYVPSLSSKLYRESGRYEEAMRVLYNFYTTTTDPRLKKSFKDSIEHLKDRVKTGDFQLRATVSRVIGVDTFEFVPDRLNPQFRFMNEKETLKITGIKPLTPLDLDPGSEREHIFARFRQEFAAFVLADQPVRIRFEKAGGLRYKQTGKGYYVGSVTLKNDRDYAAVVKESGIAPEPGSLFPPEPVDLELKEIYHQVGRVVSIRFRVHSVTADEEFIYLNAASTYRNTFRAEIPRAFIDSLAGKGKGGTVYFTRLQGRTVIVSGLALIENHRVGIKLYSPVQLRVP